MTQSSPPAVRRPPRPWWFRLGGWLLALGLVCILTLVIVGRGSFAATTHTVASDPPPSPTGAPPAELSALAEADGASYLAGPAIVRVSEDGVVASDISSGQELWRYTRTDATVCAHRVSSLHVTVMFSAGDRCDEAISLDPASGARQWQRTIEATGPNRIVWDDGTFISIDPAKAIVYGESQGYEKFTVDNSTTDHIEGEHTSCENLDAAGSRIVAVVQRCRATADEPWLYQVVLNEASDGNPREVGRAYLTEVAGPVVDGVAADGTAILRDADGVVYVLPARASEVLPIDGMPPVPPDVPLRVLTPRATFMLATASEAHTLTLNRTAVDSSMDVVATPAAYGEMLYVPTADGVLEMDAAEGAVLRTLAWPSPVEATAPAELAVHGPRIGLRDADGLTVFG